jgi:hypothetical protein
MCWGLHNILSEFVRHKFIRYFATRGCLYCGLSYTNEMTWIFNNDKSSSASEEPINMAAGLRQWAVHLST